MKKTILLLIMILVLTSCGKTDDTVSGSELESVNFKSLEAYQRFINSEECMYFDVYDMEGFDKDRAYSLDDFFAVRKNNCAEALYNYNDLEYAYIDCGNDCIQELLIRYTFSGEMSEYEGVYIFENVLKLIDGRLEMCSEAVSHYRIWESTNMYGIISSSFVDFAGANVWTSASGIDSEGYIHSIFDTSDSYAEAIPGMYTGFTSEEPDLTELSDLCNELSDSFHVYSASFGFGSLKDKKIYSYSLSGGDECKELIEEALDKSGVSWCSIDEYDKTIHKVIEEFGLTQEQFYEAAPEFSPFPENGN